MNTFKIMMTTTVKIIVDTVSLEVLSKTTAKINEDLNETSFVHCTTRRQLQINLKEQAQAGFYMPNQFTDTIVLRNGSPWTRNWPDHELVNNKPGWESLGVINGNLISGVHYDYAGNEFIRSLRQWLVLRLKWILKNFRNGTDRLLRSRHKQSQKPSTRSVRLLKNMSRAEIGRITRNTSMVLSVGGI